MSCIKFDAFSRQDGSFICPPKEAKVLKDHETSVMYWIKLYITCLIFRCLLNLVEGNEM